MTYNHLTCNTIDTDSVCWMLMTDNGRSDDNRFQLKRQKYELVADACYHRGEGWNVRLFTPTGEVVFFARFKNYLNGKAKTTKKMKWEVSDYLCRTPQAEWGRDSWNAYQDARMAERIAAKA